MYSAVSPQIIGTVKCLWALRTFVWSLACVSVNMLLQAKWMAEGFVTHGTLPLTATHVWAHTLYVSSKITEWGKDLSTFPTCITFCKKRWRGKNLNLCLNISALSLIFEVGGDIQKIARDSSCCSEVNMLVLCQSTWGYTSKYKEKSPGPGP